MKIKIYTLIFFAFLVGCSNDDECEFSSEYYQRHNNGERLSYEESKQYMTCKDS